MNTAPNHPYAQPIAPPAKKKTSPALIALLVVGCGLGALLLLGAFVYVFFVYEIEKPVADADRALLLTVDDLAPVVEGLKPAAGKGTLKKVGYLDGSSEVVYEYDDSLNEDFPLYLSSSATWEPKSSDARLVYGGMDLGLSVGLKLEDGGLGRRPCPYTLSLGAEHKCSELVYDGVPTGVVVSVLADRRVLMYMVSGIRFHDGELLTELLAPRVAKARSWKP